jgi:broad specificity phosphatase PhoE
MTERILSAYRGLTEDTCLVTHGGVITAIMASLFPEENKHRYQWQPQNGHGYRIMESGYESI